MSTLPQIIPVLPSEDIARDIKWYEMDAGFQCTFSDGMYAGLKRGNLRVHLQWHANTETDPLLGGSVIKIFVEDIFVLFDEFVEYKTISPEKLHLNTPWQTHEFGFYDLNNNAIFFVQDL